MALRLGATLCGSKYSFLLVEKLGDKTFFSPVFKAEVLSGVQSLLPKIRWAVVKSADLKNQTQVDCLVKEYKYYKKPSIESSLNFRKADLKPVNVLISNNDGLFKVKIGDLGLEGLEGRNPRWVQLGAFRAPEVWTGVTCFHKADVWSIAAMLLQRFDPNILGNADNIDKTLIHPMAWCLAKIMLLFDPSCTLISPPSDVDKTLQAYSKLAQNLTKTQAEGDSEELLLQIPLFGVWTDLVLDAGIPKVVLDVIRLLAAPNPANRPSALQALQLPEYKALQKAAVAYGN